MNRESVIFRTTEIKSNLINKMKNLIEMICFHIKDGNYQKFKEIFERNAINVESKDDDNNTLLAIAVRSNNFDIVSYLLKHNAHVNTQNREHNSPLHYALAFKNFKIANLLIKNNADENLINKKGQTPWDICNNKDAIV